MLIEGLGSATIANGVMRIETLVRNAKGEDVTGEELLIPASRVAAIAQGLRILLERAEEAVAQGQQNAVDQSMSSSELN